MYAHTYVHMIRVRVCVYIYIHTHILTYIYVQGDNIRSALSDGSLSTNQCGAMAGKSMCVYVCMFVCMYVVGHSAQISVVCLVASVCAFGGKCVGIWW